MPHVIMKLWPGKTEAQKQKLTDAIVRDVTDILGYGADAVSVGFEEVSAADWSSRVDASDIAGRWDTLLKTPGYGPGPASLIEGERS